MSAWLLEQRWAQVLMRPSKGVVHTTAAFVWFFVCIVVGALNDDNVQSYVLPVLMTIWILSIMRESAFFIGSMIDRVLLYRLRARVAKRQTFPKVSIIVPAFNEEQSIEHCIESLLCIDYPNLEIVFVDDGSSDRTLEIVVRASSRHLRVPIVALTKPNGGKASALNFGLVHASGELVLCVDSDSRLHPASLKTAVARFDDPRVAAIGGHVHIASLKNILLSTQQLEYLLGLHFPRRTMSLFGVVPVVPGPIGLFRREAILDVGGYVESRTNFAEDAELTIRMLAKGWHIVGDETMIAYTEGPEDLSSLLRQRYRWIRGMHQAVTAHLSEFFESPDLRPKIVGVYLGIESLLMPVFNFGLLLFFLSYFFSSGVNGILGIFLAYSIAIDMGRALIATHGHKGKLKWMALVFFEKLVYSNLLSTWAVLCLYDEWRQKEMSWDKLDRTGQLGASA